MLCNPPVTGLIPSFARKGRGGLNYFLKTPPTSPCKGEDFSTPNLMLTMLFYFLLKVFF
jgi:hypothetical protein